MASSFLSCCSRR